MKTYNAGIDIGSTTVKLVVLDADRQMVYGEYRRHRAHTQSTLAQLVREAYGKLGPCALRMKITGSGSINLGQALGIGFVQEVVAVTNSLQKVAPQTDVAIELGGEDAKIIYFTGGLEQRMNGVCAGGTGSFIDQMAALLQTDAAGLNEAARDYKEIYPIAARCGVFAKTDIQPLINEGATLPDLAASIFQAVVNQTISGLACGKPIRGCVAFLGGPLHFMPELKRAFIRTLKLTPENIVDPDNSHLFAAMGAALEADDAESVGIDTLMQRLDEGVQMNFELKRLDPLFADERDYQAFLERHSRARVRRGELAAYRGKAYLGIDAGSTTTKLALIGCGGELLWSFYSNNQGSPVQTAIRAVGDLREVLPQGVTIARTCSTGYGELLLKSAFLLDDGEVETIAHCRAATFFDPEVDCILDIGGQDMKFIRLKNGSVDIILLNEACASGCGSFIENFAYSLGYTAAGFAKEALLAKNPIDLGTRCTVFMNSNVKQAQKEGATVQDISAGLAYSVIKNALYKVMKVSDARELGRHCVVQGGTFYNQAVLRAFERISGAEATCPDIAGIMGAFGAALIALDRDEGAGSTMLPLDEICRLTYRTTTARCGGCSNHCMLTVNHFSGGRRFTTGNRCEKGLGAQASKEKGPNLVEYKLKRIFDYEPLAAEDAARGEIGLPRVLNMYENYPFWATFFKQLGFRTVLSPLSNRQIYQLGMESIPSESECYPAKLAHGHVQWLINAGVKTIFHPCVFFEHTESDQVQNHYNCPIVVSYAENLKNNVEDITDGKVRYLRPFLAFTSEKVAAERLVRFCGETWGIGAQEVRAAAHEAWAEQLRAKDDIRAEGQRVLQWMEQTGHKGIVLAGRPYHIDPEINHGIPEMIASYNLAVLTEDSVAQLGMAEKHRFRVTDQWVFHSRMYNAAMFVRTREDLELIQLNSFGCGLDAVTTDQMTEILEGSGKLYTVLKIDEVSNLGAARIRLRSLIAAMGMRQKQGIRPDVQPVVYEKAVFTKKMRAEGYTLLAPQMSPIHFDLLEPVFRKHGYNVVVLDNDNRAAIDAGLKFVNNDACFPSITAVGQIMSAVLSGKYDPDRLAILMTQTGGCCRASNYVGFIRRALDKAGLRQIPVVSVNANGMEKNPGFSFTPGLILDAAIALVYGDLFMRCLYRVRPYEAEPGSAGALHRKWLEKCSQSLVSGHGVRDFKTYCHKIVEDFDTLPLLDIQKPRVGIVGEILVKYMPLANNHLVELLEAEGAEAVVPDLFDFFNYSIYNSQYRYENGYGTKKGDLISKGAVKLILKLRGHAIDALEKSRRFTAPLPIEKVAEYAKPFLSVGNQYGEGWFLTGEMVELIEEDVPNIVCIQPFACLPNHVVGKGVIKVLRKQFPRANIVAVDYDPGASEVNQLNRIKLMLSAAKKQMARV